MSVAIGEYTHFWATISLTAFPDCCPCCSSTKDEINAQGGWDGTWSTRSYVNDIPFAPVSVAGGHAKNTYQCARERVPVPDELRLELFSWLEEWLVWIKEVSQSSFCLPVHSASLAAAVSGRLARIGFCCAGQLAWKGR